MSTRCQILVEGSSVVIYRHSDGYPQGPNGVLATLKPLVVEFVKYRGWDEEYLPAHIIADQIKHHKAWADKAAAEAEAEKPGRGESYKQAAFLGFGVEAYNPDSTESHSLHGDIEYLYHVRKSGVIEVLVPTDAFDEDCRLSNMKVLKRVSAKPRKSKA